MGFLTGLFSLSKFTPTLIIIGILLVLGYFGYHYLDNQTKQINTLQTYVGELKVQNQAIIAANVAITADMKAIKEGMETYNNNILDIKVNTAKLALKLSDPVFRKMLKEEVAKAQVQFNSMFNEYLQGVNDDTKNKSK